MKAMQSLPEGYREIGSVNLQKEKKTALLINGLALLIAAVMVVVMNFFVPVSSQFQGEKGLLDYFLKPLVLIASLFAYLCLHELVHGIAMKACGTKKVKYGFTGLYAFAASDDYYGKKSYIAIALAPVAVFLVVLAAVNLVVPQDWFWVVYFLQVANVAGAAGDAFVTVKFASMPKDILVRDDGVGMTVYSKSEG